MEKKGAIHIDWVISMAIFIIYLLLLLVLIKPSYKPSFEGDVLVDIIKENFIKENNVEVYKTILKFDGGSSECGCDEEPCTGYGASVANLDGLGKNNIFVEQLNANRVRFGFQGGKIIVDTLGEYEIYYSDILDIKDHTSGLDDVNYKNCDSIAVVGEDIPYIGLSDTLAIGGNYEDVKIAWDFPEARDFKIEANIFDGNDWPNKNVDAGTNPPEPYSDALVYALEINDNILGFDSESCGSGDVDEEYEKCVTLTPARILIKVW